MSEDRRVFKCRVRSALRKLEDGGLPDDVVPP